MALAVMDFTIAFVASCPSLVCVQATLSVTAVAAKLFRCIPQNKQQFPTPPARLYADLIPCDAIKGKLSASNPCLPLFLHRFPFLHIAIHLGAQISAFFWFPQIKSPRQGGPYHHVSALSMFFSAHTFFLVKIYFWC